MSRSLTQTVVAAVVLAFGFFTVQCYGKSRYEEGQRAGRVVSLDATRKAQQRAIDSAKKSLEPAFEALVRSRDELQTRVNELERTSAQATERARRAEALARALPREVRERANPVLLDALDSLSASNVELVQINADVRATNIALRAHSDSADSQAMRWRSLQSQTQLALDSANAEIGVLKQMKDKPRCGFKCGFVAGVLTIVAIVTTVVVSTH